MLSIKDKITLLVPHLFIDRIVLFLANRLKKIESIPKQEKTVFIFLACDYANLGDYAITIAQRNILLSLFKGYGIVEIGVEETYNGIKSVKARNNENDVITIIGGGNMGDLHYGYERKRNLVVESFSNNFIISFPQSLYFSSNKWGEIAKKRSCRSYSSHKHLIVLARDTISEAKMKEAFPSVKVKLCPDVVLTLNKYQKKEREGLILCIRDDQESDLSQELAVSLNNAANHVFNKITKLDTIANTSDNLEESFKSLINSFCTTDLVVTDRLHGMIFAYITGTPALVFPNNNGKIEGCFKWIENCGYIKIIKGGSIDSISSEMESIRKTKADISSLENKRKELISYFSFINNIAETN